MTLLAFFLGCPPAGGSGASDVDYRLLRPDSAEAGGVLAAPGARLGDGVVVADLRGDGGEEVLVGAVPDTDIAGAEGGTWVLDGTDLSVRAALPVEADSFAVGTTAEGPVVVARGGWGGPLTRIDDADGAGVVTPLGTEGAYDVAFAELDGDGLSDLLVARLHGEGLWAWSGVPAAYPDTPPAARYPGPSGGFSAAIAVDVDGDGVAEVLAGAPQVDDPDAEPMEQGAVYVFDGGLAGDVAAADARAVYHGRSYEGDDSWLEGFTGQQLLPGGDLDGDGLPEVLVRGTTWLWAASLAGRGDQHLDAAALARFDGERSWRDSPGAAAAVLDYTGDGVADLAVGAPHAQVDGLEMGAVYLMEGPVAGAHDLGEAAAVKIAGATVDDELGAALAVVHPAGGGSGLVVGAPGTESGSDGEAGAVWLWGAEALAGD